MEEKTKFIIMGFIGILIVSLFINFQVYSSKQEVVRDRDILKNDNIALAKKAEESLNDNRRLEERINSLNMDLEKISKAKDELAVKVNFLNREKDDLVKKIKSQATPAAAVSSPMAQEEPKVSVGQGAEDMYWAGVLKAKKSLEVQLENVNSQLKTMQIKGEQMKKDKNVLDLEVKSLNRDKQDLKRQLEYNQKLIDSLAQELVREKNDKFDTQTTVSSLKDENEVIKRQLKSLNVRKINLESKVTELQREKFDFENKLTVMDSVLKDNISQMDGLKRQFEAAQKERLMTLTEPKNESVELPPIVVRPQAEMQKETAGASTTGKVLTVNEDSGFVIINIGEDAGLRMGDTFQVYRDNDSIATIEVIQLRPNIAACDIKKSTAAIKSGDIIR